MAYSRSRMAMAKQSGKSKAQVKGSAAPKASTLDKPGASVVKRHTSSRSGRKGSRARERRLMGRTL